MINFFVCLKTRDNLNTVGTTAFFLKKKHAAINILQYHGVNNNIIMY